MILLRNFFKRLKAIPKPLILGFVLLIVFFQNFTPNSGGYSIPGTGYTNCILDSGLQKCTMNYRGESTPNSNYDYDVYLPPSFSAANLYPLVVMIHGGSWSETNSNRSSESGISRNLANAGFIVANIEYTRSNYTESSPTGGPYYSGAEDVAEFGRLIMDNPVVPSVFRFDQSKVIIAGISAGAHLAALEAAKSRRPYLAVALRAPPVDLMKYGPGNPFYSQYQVLAPGGVGLVDKVFGANAQHLAEMSPISYVSQLNSRYLFIEHSNRDALIPMEQVQDFARRVPCTIQAQYNFVTGYGAVGVGGHNWSDSDTSKFEHFIKRMGSASPGVDSYKLNFAKASSELYDDAGSWSAYNILEGKSSTSFSSMPGSRYNPNGYNLEAHFLSGNLCAKSVSSITLSARMFGSVPLGFPKKYNVLIPNATNSAWEFLGNFSLQPVNGQVTIRLPSARRTHGVLIHPTELGTDNYGNYYFQLADLSLNR